jgi:mRNA interferase MazF
LARGDIITVAAGGGYGGKPRPAVVVQADEFSDSEAVTFCLITSVFVDVPRTRLRIEPSPGNGIKKVSWIMADKIMTVRSDKIGRRVGRLSAADMAALDHAIALYLGLAR